MQHVIRKQVIDLHIDKQLDSFRIQQLLSDHFWRVLVPLLGNEFDKISTENEVISLERVEIDLGLIRETEINKAVWSTDLLEPLKNQVREVILSEITVSPQPSVKRSFVANGYRKWLYYMQNGHLPWNVSSVDSEWYNQVMEELAINYSSITELKKEIIGNPILLTRIIRQHTPVFLISLLEVLTAEKQPKLLWAIDKILPKKSKQNPGASSLLSDPSFDFYEEIWHEILKRSSLEGHKKTPDELLNMVLDFQSEKIRLEGLGSIADKKVPDPDFPSKGAAVAIAGKEASLLDVGPVAHLPGLPDAGNAQNKKMVKEGIYVQHTGLVLIHPFLNSLFNQLGLLAGKSFANTELQERAVYLLHYVVTGRTKAEEYELVLPKILCGYPIDFPVKANVRLSAKQRKEADHMLQAAIASWEILKSTSPDGLREGFLQRSGKVLIENEKIKILVEKAAIDVLLDHLPWNLSIIKLPWLEEIIKVEWR
ncbi:contractile injection system tape measure protein [Pedobacter caeni]|uniref:Uncharacterized protein n=1 Tax=Pedobacter caeni TaxID=288992 RepID=A0A1M4U5B3_9SPHI|nr:contractile injection system tape measure protein [Pedobacter caeni]SHE51858.1 hypothetical protein SAMN04488522_101435 [Pedobacter caeni]